MLKILFGVEPYCIDKAVEALEKGITSKELNVSYFDGLSSEIISASKTFPFLDNKRLIVVRLETLTEEVLKYTNVPAFTELVLLPEKVDKGTKVYKQLEKAGATQECVKLTEKQLQTFVIRYLKDNEGAITEKAYKHFVERTGYLENDSVSLYTVEVYLKQLLLLGNVITEEAIEKIVPLACNEKVFALSKALTDGNSDYAIWLCKQFLERGEQPIQLLSLLLRPFRLGYKASLYAPNEVNEACAMIGVSAYQIKSMMCYPDEVLNKGMDIIQEGIANIKKGGGKNMFFLAIARLILLLCPNRNIKG